MANKYLDLTLSDANDFILSQIDYDSNQPILEKCSDYDVTVQSFSIPSSLIPILLFKNKNFKIAYQFGATTVVKSLDYSVINYTGQLYKNEQPIFHYHDMLDIINKALADGFADIKLLQPAIDSSTPAFVSHDAEAELCIYNMQTNSGNLKCYFNDKLYTLFSSFQSIEEKIGSETFFNILNKDNGNNTETINGLQYYSTYQNYNTMPIWSDLKKILMITGSIPVNSEYVTAGSSNIYLLTDFEARERIFDRTNYEYEPNGPQRYYELNSDDSLYSADIKLYWADKKNNIYPIYQSPLDYTNIVLKFRKKQNLII